MKRYAHNLSHVRTLTAKMGLCYPLPPMPVYPGDSFRLSISNLTRFLPQVSPTMHEVNLSVDTYTVPLRQLADKIGLDWDKHLTGGRKGTDNIPIPTITIPEDGYDPGSLADFLGYPTNYTDPDTGDNVVVGAGLKLSAWRVLAYMHVIGENYLDQNFIKELDYSRYQDFLDGTYQFEDLDGNPIDADFVYKGIFPKAWNRDYFGRALPDTQRGPQVTLPVGDSASLVPAVAPIITGGYVTIGNTTKVTLTFVSNPDYIWTYDFVTGSVLPTGRTLLTYKGPGSSPLQVAVRWNGATPIFEHKPYHDWVACGSQYTVSYSDGIVSATAGTGSVADLSSVQSDLANATGIGIIAFRLASRMQRFGEILQQSGARAVEFTMAMFGVRIPDDRIQRPIFHGTFRLPVIFSEVLQTSQSTNDSPQGNLAGHGITGGQNSPIHIKVIEHGYIIHIMHIMPRSQYQTIIPRDLLYKTRFDYPNPLLQNVGEQGIKRVEIYPNSANPNEYFGFVPRFSELSSIPSTLHGHMKDTFLHMNMARIYNNGEPVLSAEWRYEPPTSRSFSVQDEDHMQISLGFNIKARRCFARNPQPGISIV